MPLREAQTNWHIKVWLCPFFREELVKVREPGLRLICYHY